MSFRIDNLRVKIKGKTILDGIDLKMERGEIHAVMGPNGAGKSTLAKTAAGHGDCEVVEGAITLDGADLLAMEPEERARKGLFIGFQYPIEIPGVSNFEFLFHACNATRCAQGEKELDKKRFASMLDEALRLVDMDPSFKERHLNDGFSGGEKKRNEIVQMALLKPKVAILDETDSGLDIDALQKVARGIRQVMNENMSILLITHYQRLLNFVKPDFVHIMRGGKVVRSGGFELAALLEERGYEMI